jgi:hypothetical protein
MAFTNYTTFVATVANYLARTDLTDTIPDFVELAQERMSRELRVRQMLKIATADVTGGDATVSLPTDFLELREMHFVNNPVINLEYQTPDLFFRNHQTTTSGISHYYTLLAQEFQFAPISTGSTVQILYYAKPEFISTTVASNDFLAYFPDALLYSTLAEAEPYLMNDERIGTWSSLYDRAITNIKTNDLGSKYPNTSLMTTAR